MTGTWPTGWATGDIETAAEFKKGIGAISDTTLGGTAANVDITSIVATYAHLLIVVYARGDSAGLNSVFGSLRFNNDSAANYDSQELHGAGATVLASEAFGATSLKCGVVPTALAGANLFSAYVAFIPNYAGSTNNKVALSMTGIKTGVTTGLLGNYLMGGFWRSNAAINRVTLFPVSGNFVAGTRVTLYGMGA